MSEIASRTVGSEVASGRNVTSMRTDPRRIDITPHRGLGVDVLSRDHFLTQLHREKRRADRSRAPLSLVVMHFANHDRFDEDDFRDIITDLCLNTRETDVIGCLGGGVVAFLLPYSAAEAADAFSKLIVRRTNTPAANLQFASYSDPNFDTLLIDALAQIETSQVSARQSLHKKISPLGVKRAIDIIGATALLILAAPVMIVTAVAVKLTSPGPVIFRQMRIGQWGRPFPFYKFRSMRIDNDDAIHREYVTNLIQGRHDDINEGDADNPVYKLRSDGRITAVGKILRRSSIDELPQLFNVLKGEMTRYPAPSCMPR